MGPTPSLPLSLHPAMHARSTLEHAHGARARTLRPARRAGKVRSPPYPRPSLARAPSPPPDARVGRREERLCRWARAAEKAGKVRSSHPPHLSSVRAPSPRTDARACRREERLRRRARAAEKAGKVRSSPAPPPILGARKVSAD